MYVVKIDVSKPHVCTDYILGCIKENRLWLNEDADNYVSEKEARQFKTKKSAEKEITEDWEIVEKI